MLEKLQTFRRFIGDNIGDTLLHKGNGIGIGDRRIAENQFGHLVHLLVLSLIGTFIKTKLNV